MTRATGPIEITGSPWHVHHGEPTTLLAFLPGTLPPDRNAVVAQLERFGATKIEHANDPSEQPGVLWQAEVSAPCVRGNAVLWCENAQQVAPGTFNDPEIESSNWIVGTQALLHVDEPSESYMQLLHLLISAMADSPGLLDLNTNMCHPRAFLTEQLALADAPAPIDWLWRIDVVAADSSTEANTPLWLRTAGLLRCWRAELELFNVPYSHAAAAGRLLHLLAEQSLDGPLPDPGMPFEVGANLRVSLQPAAQCIASLDADAIGSADFRAANGIDQQHPAAVVVTALPDAAHSSTMVPPPLDVLHALHKGDAAIYRTIRSTARQAALARSRWPGFVDAWQQAAQSGAADTHFLVKAAITADVQDVADREHIWMEVDTITDSSLIAQPLHDTTTTSAIAAEDRCELDPDGISDWLILTPTQRLGPAHLPAESASSILETKQ